MRKLIVVIPILCFVLMGYFLGHIMGSIKTADKYEEVLNSCIENNQRMTLKYLLAGDNVPHVCSDTTHEGCLHFCDCNGTECMVHKRDYEIELHMDTVWVYSTDRLVGWYIDTSKNQIDEILINDNL
jgi:hypothetical protein